MLICTAGAFPAQGLVLGAQQRVRRGTQAVRTKAALGQHRAPRQEPGLWFSNCVPLLLMGASRGVGEAASGPFLPPTNRSITGWRPWGSRGLYWGSFRKTGCAAKKQTKETETSVYKLVKVLVLGPFLTSLAPVLSPTKWSW